MKEPSAVPTWFVVPPDLRVEVFKAAHSSGFLEFLGKECAVLEYRVKFATGEMSAEIVLSSEFERRSKLSIPF
jgi:hypothetical protein